MLVHSGAGSNVKMVNQLLAGVHIAAAAEAMALGARAGLDTRVLYDIISNAAGSSWMVMYICLEYYCWQCFSYGKLVSLDAKILQAEQFNIIKSYRMVLCC